MYFNKGIKNMTIINILILKYVTLFVFILFVSWLITPVVINTLPIINNSTKIHFWEIHNDWTFFFYFSNRVFQSIWFFQKETVPLHVENIFEVDLWISSRFQSDSIDSPGNLIFFSSDFGILPWIPTTFTLPLPQPLEFSNNILKMVVLSWKSLFSNN